MDTLPLTTQIINYLNYYIENEIDLKIYARMNKLPIYGENDSKDKGWRGNIIEHMLNIKKNNNAHSDYEGLEIKTVPVLYSQKKVKETTCLAVIDPKEILTKEFEKSSLYKKIKNTLFILIDVENNKNIIVKTFLCNFDKFPEIKDKMINDYNQLANHITDNLYYDYSLSKNFTGKIGEVIQPRPKVGKKGTYTWAFYLKSKYMNQLLFPIHSLDVLPVLKRRGFLVRAFYVQKGWSLL